MALADIADLARHPTMVRRVTAAAVKAAVSIGNEEECDDSRYRTRRSALATMVLRYAETWGEVFSWAVAANPSITVDSPDSDIERTVNAMWDPIAGAYQENPA